MSVVRLLELDNSGQQVECGRLTWNGRLRAQPEADFMRQVLRAVVNDPDDTSKLLTVYDGERWLANLHRYYTGSYFRATQLEQDGQQVLSLQDVTEYYGTEPPGPDWHYAGAGRWLKGGS